MIPVRKMTFMALLVAFAMVLSYIETIFPLPIPVPGVKLGLANVITITAILFLGLKETLLIVVVRTLLGSFMIGGLYMALYSLSAGVISALVMYILYKYCSKVFSLVGVSIAGALAHNTAQITVAAITLKDRAVFSYMPILAISAIIMGIFVGIIAKFVSTRLNRINLFEEV